MIIRSYGCSFIFGTDLADDGRNGPYATPSNFTWPALTAAKLQQPYVCRAKGGAGNLQILDCILRDAACNEQSLFLIGWSYCDRFDMVTWIPVAPPRITPLFAQSQIPQKPGHITKIFTASLETSLQP